MSIGEGVAVLGLLGTVATTFLALFVSNKVHNSEARMMDKIATVYMTRELVAERFRVLDQRLDDHIGRHDTARHRLVKGDDV